MIKSETITINGKEYIRTWSDSDLMIERDGIRYERAVDPAYLGRTYTETDEPVSDEELTDSEALAIITGGAV